MFKRMLKQLAKCKEKVKERGKNQLYLHNAKRDVSMFPMKLNLLFL